MAVEGIIANGVTEILKKLSSIVANEITLVWDFNDKLKNLQSTLNMIMVVMEDAENKQVGSKYVRLWMEDLKAIAYDAEDILDNYSYKIIRKCTQTGEVRKPSLFFRSRMARKVKKINKKLNEITKRKNDLRLQTIEVGSSSSHELMMMNRETYSLVAEDWKIVGRENDKSNLIKMLLEEEILSNNICSTNQGGGGGKHVSVIPIVGMGGLGKTTMAQLVYNDEVVQKHFQLKVWICVSHPFDIKKLYKNIGNSIGKGKEYDDATTMNAISHLLQDDFRGKKFILVLDDVWNEKPADWYNFKTPFMVGQEGSKILVTTRNEKVALIMVDKFQPYPLGILNENDCWYLFNEIAFGSIAGAEETSNLVEIGKEMVKRCGGLPLAVIFLGSLMRSKKKEEEWKIIRDTKLWHEFHEGKNSEILPSLRLSYDYLPSHLKQCFSYCCLFPKDFEIHRETLIRLWMAEGFLLIESPGENMMSMEEIGNDYFHSLLCNFFFQEVKKDVDGDIATCKMHDLVHDLARSVVGKNECLIVESARDIDYISEETRRLNLLVVLDDDEEEMLPKAIEAMKKAKKLRTVFVNGIHNTFDIGNAFKENKRLRVLDLSGSDVRAESTLSIGGLKHLRYLNASEISVPKGGIARLRFLQTLGNFTVGGDKKECKNTSVIEELEGLNLLTGDLSIGNLECVTSGSAASRANLKEKKNVRGLHLSWNTTRSDHAKNAEAVLEGLRPHPHLRTLAIEGFEGAKLPRWMEDSSCLPNLVKLTLSNNKCEQVAGFGALPSLRSLLIFGVRELECIGNELYYSAVVAGGSSSATGGGESSSSSTASTGEASTTIAFPSLKKFSLVNMQSLNEWVVPAPSTSSGATCFPLLEVITIARCPHLSMITPTTTIFSSLKVLNLAYIDGSAAETLVTNNLNSLTSLRLYSIPNLITLPRQGLMENNNTLLSLRIECCYKFQGFFPPNKYADDQEGGGQQLQISQVAVSSSSSFSSLQSLKLYYCPALRFFPDICSLTSLRKLKIRGCNISKSLQDELTCLSSSLEHLEHVLLRN